MVGGLVVSFRTGWQGDGFVSGFCASVGRWFHSKFGSKRSDRKRLRAAAVNDALALSPSAIHIRAVRDHLIRYVPSKC